MRKALFGILSISILTACNTEEENTDGDSDTAEISEETVSEDDDSVEGAETVTDADETEEEELEEAQLEFEPIVGEHDMWDFSEELLYNLSSEIGPIIREGEYAILPITLDSEDEIETSFRGLFDVGLSTGEGNSSRQGYDIRVIDSQENTVSEVAVLQFEDNLNTALQTFIGEGAGRRTQMTIGADYEPAKYYAVIAAPESENVHVMLTGEMGIIENIPVIDREEIDVMTLEEANDDFEQDGIVPTVEEIIEKEISTSQENALADGEETINARVSSFESYRESVETTVSRIDEVEQSTLILSSDVLFDVDVSDLSEEADAELEAAILELEGVEGGELEIVGHTDNVLSEEYNQELSEERANSVVERLSELTDLDIFDEVSNRGESFREPIATNESDEGRTQNRRVEIHFTPPVEEVVIETEGELPEALGKEAEYPETVQTQYGEIEIESIRRVDELLIGRVRVRANEDGNAAYDALTQAAGIGARGWYGDETGNYNQWSVYAVTLIDGDQRYYPIDYYLEPLEGSRAEERSEETNTNFIVPLADRNISNIENISEDGFYTATVIWPAVDAEEIAVDHPFNDYHGDHQSQIKRSAPWRIVNVPIVE